MSHVGSVALCLLVLLMNCCAPREESAQSEPATPPAPLEAGDARTFTKLIEGSVSPSRRLAVAVGTADRSRPEWQSVSHDGAQPSFVLVDQSNTANYLVSLEDFQALARLDSDHSGTAPAYNHQSVAFRWSLDSRWLVEERHWKWHTAQCTVHRLDRDGKILARFDLKPLANEILLAEMLRSVPGARPADIKRYAQRIKVLNMTNDGFLTVNLTGEIPKDAQGRYIETKVTAKLTQGAHGGLMARIIND